MKQFILSYFEQKARDTLIEMIILSMKQIVKALFHEVNKTDLDYIIGMNSPKCNVRMH